MIERELTKLTSTKIVPPKLRRVWRGKPVFVLATDDQIVITRAEPLSWDELRKRLKEAGKEVSFADLEETIAHALSPVGAERNDWRLLASNALERAYGENEPSYTSEMIKDSNPEYEGR